MVRKGSPVRVRQRALTKALQAAAAVEGRGGTSALVRIAKVLSRYSTGRCRRSPLSGPGARAADARYLAAIPPRARGAAAGRRNCPIPVVRLIATGLH